MRTDPRREREWKCSAWVCCRQAATTGAVPVRNSTKRCSRRSRRLMVDGEAGGGRCMVVDERDQVVSGDLLRLPVGFGHPAIGLQQIVGVGAPGPRREAAQHQRVDEPFGLLDGLSVAADQLPYRLPLALTLANGEGVVCVAGHGLLPSRWFGQVEQLVDRPAVEQEAALHQPFTSLPQPVEAEVQLLADALVGVEREPLGIADALQEHVQRDLLGAHPPDVLVVDQPPVHRAELHGHRAHPFGVHRLLENLPTCSSLRRRRALRGLPAAWFAVPFSCRAPCHSAPEAVKGQGVWSPGRSAGR